jgi:ComF family protein
MGGLVGLTAISYKQSKQAIQHILDFLFPPHCAACKRSGSILCPSCLTEIRPLTPPLCQHCYTPLAPHEACRRCRYHPLHMSGLRAASIYQGTLRTCIHDLKYNGNTRLAEPLGCLLVQTYLITGMQADIITPVPLHHERLQQRGYNQARLLAKACASRLGIPMQDTLLTRSRPTPAQVHLTASERQQNVAGAFLCNPTLATGALRKRRIIIIDDVSTTGATLEACAAPLFSAGALAVWGLVLARSL